MSLSDFKARFGDDFSVPCMNCEHTIGHHVPDSPYQCVGQGRPCFCPGCEIAPLVSDEEVMVIRSSLERLCRF